MGRYAIVGEVSFKFTEYVGEHALKAGWNNDDGEWVVELTHLQVGRMARAMANEVEHLIETLPWSQASSAIFYASCIMRWYATADQSETLVFT